MPEDREPKDQLKEGLGLLWRAARGAATVIKKDLDRSGVGKSLDDAGREIARAATNVIGRIGSEIQKAQGPAKPPREEPDEKDPPPREDDDDEAQPPPAKKPTGPTKSDPGFRIAVDNQDPSSDDKPR